MAPRTPNAGEPFYLDGHRYILGGSKERFADDGAKLVHRFFERPAAPDAKTAALHKASVNYKLSGAVADQSEMRWVTRAEFLTMAREQADKLVSGGTTPAARLWGNAGYQAVEEVVSSWPESFWMLPDRCLIDPPCTLGEGGQPIMAVPTSAADALRLARAALDHSFYASKEG